MNDTQITPEPPSDRAAINRANSQNSTGPRTDAGKQRSSMNAQTHGLTGKTIVTPEEDLDAYHRRTQRYFDELQPKGIIEEQLVQLIADTAWRLNRVPALEAKLLTVGEPEQSESMDHVRKLSALSMHDHRLTRKFDNARKQLTALQAERREREKCDMALAGDLLEMHQGKGLPYDPAVDGFVFTVAEIEIHVERKHRLKQSADAAFRRLVA